ncbi:hypothetical protein COBT_000075 [Conglomerata obtusa]
MIVFPSTKKEEFKLHKENGTRLLANDRCKIPRHLEQVKTAPNYFIIKENDNGKFVLENTSYSVNKAEIYTITLRQPETVIEKHETPATMDSLIQSFGNKKAKLLYQGFRETEKRKVNQQIYYTFEEQILPVFDGNAKKPEDIYKIQDMFPATLLDALLKVDYNVTMIHADLQRDFDVHYSLEFLILDCIYKLFDRKKINILYLHTSFITGCESFCDFLQDYVSGKFLTDKARDRLAMIAYVLILIINDYKIKLDALPKFKYETLKIVTMMKSLGCVYNEKSGMFILTKAPVLEIQQKRRKRMN